MQSCTSLIIKVLFCATFIFCAAIFGRVQAQQKLQASTILQLPNENQISAESNFARSTAAYSEVYAQKIETEVDLKVLGLDFTEETVQMREKRLELDLLTRDIKFLESLPSAAEPKLTVALGRMLVRRVQAEVNLKSISAKYAEDHPQVKKARARLEIYNNTIQKLLQ